MIEIRELIQTGKVVCPVTKQKLYYSHDGSGLITSDGSISYPIVENVPILTRNYAQFEREAKSVIAKFDQKANYAKTKPWLGKLEELARRDYRTENSVKAFQSVFAEQSPGAVLLNIGGGPGRIPELLNLNMDVFTNVDIVADAHDLPFERDTVDAINCEAVLEHLKNPNEAVREMYRVLKPGSKLFAATPFLQNYHGYPHHYQNFTHVGHRYLFESNGFTVLEADTCVGPLYTILALNALFIHDFFPAFIARPLWYLFRYLTIPLRPLNRKLGQQRNAYKLASTTYLVAAKPK